MRVEQFVMAYGAEQDRLRALLPEGFTSLRPVVRINAELRDGSPYLECNTAAEHDGLRGWINVGHWDADSGLTCTREGKTVTFSTEFLEISFTGVGLTGGCPAEKDNAGCFFPDEDFALHPAEAIDAYKEFCDCAFAWHFAPGDAHGVSLGMTLPAIPTPQEKQYPRRPLTAEHIAAIPCTQVLGTYTVTFER